jgi:hypothetical protein
MVVGLVCRDERKGGEKKTKTTAGETFRHQCGGTLGISFTERWVTSDEPMRYTSPLPERQQHVFGIRVLEVLIGVCHTFGSVQETRKLSHASATISNISKSLLRTAFHHYSSSLTVIFLPTP